MIDKRIFVCRQNCVALLWNKNPTTFHEVKPVLFIYEKIRITEKLLLSVLRLVVLDAGIIFIVSEE